MAPWPSACAPLPVGMILMRAKDRAEMWSGLAREILWLRLNRLQTMFVPDKSFKYRCLRELPKAGGLSSEAVVAKNATVQIEADQEVGIEVESFNLDAVFSEGCHVNPKRGTRVPHLGQAVRLIADSARRRDLFCDEESALHVVGGNCSRALESEAALRIVDRLRREFAEPEVFGVEKDKALASALGAVMQTAGGREVYRSLEKKAANLLYDGVAT